MEKVLSFLLIIISINVVAQNNNDEFKLVEYSDVNFSQYAGKRLKIYKVTDADSIVFTLNYDWFDVDFYRKNELIFNLDKIRTKEEQLNIEPIGDSLFVTFYNYYIFKIIDFPGISYRYAVLKSITNGIKYLGVTDVNTALIFGDIDNDNKFEIGGYNRIFENGIESYGNYEETYDNYFRIYEVNEKFIQETELSSNLKPYFIQRLNQGFNYFDSYKFQFPIFNLQGESNYESRYNILRTIKITESMLNNIPVEKLRIMRNEIFARHGYIFKSQDLKEYFSKFDWYKPKFENVSDNLSEIEKYNIEIIYNKEKK